jgi:hypothetical protein
MAAQPTYELCRFVRHDIAGPCTSSAIVALCAAKEIIISFRLPDDSAWASYAMFKMAM